MDCIRNVLVGNPFFTILRKKLNPVTGNWGLDPTSSSRVWGATSRQLPRLSTRSCWSQLTRH